MLLRSQVQLQTLAWATGTRLRTAARTRARGDAGSITTEMAILLGALAALALAAVAIITVKVLAKLRDLDLG